MGSAAAAQGPKHRRRALLLRATWRLSGPGIEAPSLAPAGRSFTTGPPGEPRVLFPASIPTPPVVSGAR